ncbi:POTRA domain-containing protein [Lacinutrix sp. Bg11-31]|uniref:POTRA domain-containing protein n=1 Tax=Lacinutrix sp. Bg11-31 TaxID=2057808 RepID=UPI001E597D63|nr:POTRA domain-containing protein [Lacinutrix sp. Bg11-31]
MSLKITGSNEKETTIITNFGYKQNHFDYNSIINEANSFHEKIIKTGYIESKRLLIKKNNDSSFQIKFQLKNKYETIEINYDSTKIKKSLISSVYKESSSNYFVVPFNNIEETLEHINIKIANNGFPFTKVKLSEIKIKDKKTLVAQLIIEKEENKRSLDKIVIKGYEKFPKSYLRRYLKIKPNKVFNIETIKNKMIALNNLRFAEQTKESEVLFTKDSTTLYIYLQKSQSNTFDGFLGFSTNEETNKLDFNGYIDLELNNNLNYGETFNLLYKSDESEQKNFEAILNLPYLFSTPIGTEISLKILKRDSSFTSVNQKASVFYQLNSKNRVFLGIESTESSNLLENKNNSPITDYKSNLYNLKYIFENRWVSNSLFQIKNRVKLELGLGKRKTDLYNEGQEKITIDAFHSFQLNLKNSFFTRINGALLNSDSYFENELFRFGGINSIRGFTENSVLASRYIILNTEYRYKLSNSIYAHTILDFSNFENKLSKTKENLYGFGLGFGIKTKAGLLKFNFANGKTETQSFQFSNSKIHLSLVSIF